MTLNEKYLNKLIKENIFVDVYTDRYDSSNFGFIIEYNSDFIVLEKYNDDSIFDGVGVFFLENITRIRWNGNEIESVRKFVDNSTRLKEKINIDLSSPKSIIDSLNEKYGYVTVHIQDIDSDVCFIGEIVEIDNETLIMNEFGTKISLDRKMIMISTTDITLIESGGEYEEKIKRLVTNKS